MTKYTIEKNLKDHILEWSAMFLSVLGALLISVKILQGYYVWLIANVLWMFFAKKHKHYGLLTMAISYFIINVIGIIRWHVF